MRKGRSKNVLSLEAYYQLHIQLLKLLLYSTPAALCENYFLLCSLEEADLPESNVHSYFFNGFMDSKY